MPIRITGGELGGRLIHSPDGRDTRPTSALVRQALCNILNERCDGARVLDLFAGSGAIAFELLSRGAREAILLEKARPILTLLQRSVSDLKLVGRALVQGQDVLKLLLMEQPPLGLFDIIYADPPFVLDYPDLRPSLTWLQPDGVAIFEMPTRKLPEWSSAAFDLRRYGESTLAFFRA